MRKCMLASAFLAALSLAFALTGFANPSAPVPQQVRSALEQAITYLEKTQQPDTQNNDHFEGEWPSRMENLATIALVGKKGKTAYDSNSFTVSSVHNSLAAAYLRQPDLTAIPPLLDRAIGRILSYRDKKSDAFNFWPLLPPAPELQIKEPILVRRPNHYYQNSRFAAGFCNIVNDADDTSVALLALKQYEQIRPDSGSQLSLPKKIGPIFSAFLDKRRPYSHPYNAFHGMGRTGAFMTWLAKETSIRPGGFLPSLKHPGIPLGVNDVDCVVNANILSTLAHFEELGTPGAKEACRLINWAFSHGKQQSCGTYYPSPYNLHYVTAKAIEAGASCLDPSIKPLIDELISNQNRDGSWNSSVPRDKVHSSLYALNALLYLRDHSAPENREPIQSAVDRGIVYILGQQQPYTEGGAYWQGGAFFSAGTLAREKLIWTSESYTTALAVDALSFWLKHNR